MNALSGRIADPSPSVRRAAITALGRLGDAPASDGIAAALNDTFTSVRHAAARALAAIDTDAARAALGRVNAGTDEVLRSIVVRAQWRRWYRI